MSSTTSPVTTATGSPSVTTTAAIDAWSAPDAL
jgi:hypothetical protein